MTVVHDHQFPEYRRQYYIITRSRCLISGTYIGKDTSSWSKTRYAFMCEDGNIRYVRRRSIFTQMLDAVPELDKRILQSRRTWEKKAQ